MNDDDWRTQAACRGLDPELFFPPRGNRTATEAKAVCRTCPVRTQCLDFANSYPEPERHGVWGGVTERQRRRMRGSQSARPGRPRIAKIAEHGTAQRARICDDLDGGMCEPCRAALNQYKRSHRAAS